MFSVVVVCLSYFSSRASNQTDCSRHHWSFTACWCRGGHWSNVCKLFIYNVMTRITKSDHKCSLYIFYFILQCNKYELSISFFLSFILFCNVTRMSNPQDLFSLFAVLQSHVYGYARRPEDEQQDCDQHHAGCFPRGPQDTRRVPDSDPELRGSVFTLHCKTLWPALFSNTSLDRRRGRGTAAV